jgi:hypothetical protein
MPSRTPVTSQRTLNSVMCSNPDRMESIIRASSLRVDG